MYLLMPAASEISSTRLPSRPLLANSEIATCRMRSRVSTPLRFGLAGAATVSLGKSTVPAQRFGRDSIELERRCIDRNRIVLARESDRDLLVAHVFQHTFRLTQARIAEPAAA